MWTLFLSLKIIFLVNTFEKCSIRCKPRYTNLLEFSCMLCLWSAQGGSSRLYGYWAGFCQLPSNKTYQRIQDNQTIELTWMSLYGEMFPQVTFKIFLTTSWISNHLRIMAIFLNGVSNWSQFAFLINRNKTSTFPALGCQFKSCWSFLSFFLFSCFSFFPFLTYFLSVWRFFENCIFTIKIGSLYRKCSKVLKFFERNQELVLRCLRKENNRHLAMLPLVSPPHDVWETSS